jgi:hypothetical protein
VTTLLAYPRLVDLMAVCHNLCDDERHQYEVFAARPYDPDTVAATYFLKPDPKWVIVADNFPVIVAGFTQLRPGVWQDWLFSTPDAWIEKNWRSVTRHCRRVMDGMLRSEAHRLQCLSLASRTNAHKWYRPLGLVRTGGTLHGYGANGEDALMFERLRSPDGH